MDAYIGITVENAILGKHEAALARLQTTRETLKALREQEAAIVAEIGDIKAAARVLGVTLPPDTVEGPPPGEVKAYVLGQLAAHPQGVRAREIRESYLSATSKTIHEKTVGMTLYRLMGNGQARRIGHVWYPT